MTAVEFHNLNHQQLQTPSCSLPSLTHPAAGCKPEAGQLLAGAPPQNYFPKKASYGASEHSLPPCLPAISQWVSGSQAAGRGAAALAERERERERGWQRLSLNEQCNSPQAWLLHVTMCTHNAALLEFPGCRLPPSVPSSHAKHQLLYSCPQRTQHAVDKPACRGVAHGIFKRTCTARRGSMLAATDVLMPL